MLLAKSGKNAQDYFLSTHVESGTDSTIALCTVRELNCYGHPISDWNRLARIVTAIACARQIGLTYAHAREYFILAPRYLQTCRPGYAVYRIAAIYGSGNVYSKRVDQTGEFIGMVFTLKAVFRVF
jgi:hypothetical protein